MSNGAAQVSHQICQLFVGFLCLLVRVTMVDKNKAVVLCVSFVCLLVRVNMVDKNKVVVYRLLATSAIMLSEKKKRKRKI
jgi:hypothetical protein